MSKTEMVYDVILRHKKTGEEMLLKFDQYEFSFENQVVEYRGKGGFTEMTAGFQKRGLLKLWSGMRKYEDFVPVYKVP